MKMLCPAWLLAMTVMSVSGQCWEQEQCRDLTSEESIMECMQLCRSDLTAESPIYPGKGHLQPPSLADTDGSSVLLASTSPTEEDFLTEPQRQDKRSYSMEHFRWGKPVGRKRRPVKVYSGNPEEESTEITESRRNLDYPASEADLPADHPQASVQKKQPYKMGHFRWSQPPASKRYGGFMKPWDERGQKPLMTLFKNVMIKDVQKNSE